MKCSFYPLLTLTIFLNSFSNAQIASDSIVLINEKFEKTFVLSPKDCTKDLCGVFIYDSFYANEARETSRIYREINKPIDLTGSLGMTPTSEFNPTLTISIDKIESKGESNKVFCYFEARSLKNGGEKDTRATELFYSSVINGTKIALVEQLIGRFENTESTTSIYKFEIPNVPNGASIAINLVGKRSKDLAGTAAKLIIDNLIIGYKSSENPSSTLQTNNPLNLTWSIDSDIIVFNQPITGIIYDLYGRQISEIKTSQIANISNLSAGYYIFKSDKAIKFQFVKPL